MSEARLNGRGYSVPGSLALLGQSHVSESPGTVHPQGLPCRRGGGGGDGGDAGVGGEGGVSCNKLFHQLRHVL